MKKIVVLITIFVAALFVPGQLHAQFDLGLKAGYNASTLTTDIDSIESDMSSGFHIGAFARFGKRVHLQPEIYYTVSGATFQNVGVGIVNDWKQKVTVGTLDIPVLVGFSIIESKLIKWRIMVGPQASFVVNSKIENVSLTGPLETSDINTVNWYLQAGTGVDVWFVTLDLRYQAGLNSMIGDVTGNDGKVYPANTQGNMFVVSLGFKIF